MKRFGVILTLLAALVVPAGATAFSGSASSPGFSNGCDPITIDQSGLSLVDTADGYHLSGALVLTGSPSEPIGCSFSMMYVTRMLAEAVGTELIVTVSQTADLQLTGDWQMQYYSMWAYMESPCNQSQYQPVAFVLSPSSGSFNLAPVSGAACPTATVYSPDRLYGAIQFALVMNGPGSATITYGNSAEFAAIPVNPVPEPASIVVAVSGVAVLFAARRRMLPRP